ncbi:MAG: LysR family transcriptional regulator [endosymbiont of Galathealinum brachiosum]|uniref:LysR family transcriptional regulator n=1 Tax=endosymbiont of Galathealinum brachiosum TaxID=2200906 RepID=A0A370DBJ8_9GAMM|nr:MAG: LysR family transcriptional regulator [endosymbiont of Galathealinum brachiosum]
MTLTELKYIVAVAQYKHFGKAAKACFVSQPTLSLGIKKLEEELELSIFEREARNELRITEQGAQIIEQAQKVLDQASHLKTLAQAHQDPLAAPLRLGAIYTIAPYLLPELIPRLHKRAPQMQLRLEENFTAVLSEQLKQGKLDVILIALPFNEAGVMTQAVYDEPFEAVIPVSHHWQDRQQIKANELAQENLLLLGPGHCFRDQVLQACPDCSSSSNLQESLAGGSLETIRHMVASGTGITVLPSSSKQKATNNPLIKMIPFINPAPQRRVALAWRKGFTRPEAIEVLRQQILKCSLSGVNMLTEETTQTNKQRL